MSRSPCAVRRESCSRAEHGRGLAPGPAWMYPSRVRVSVRFTPCRQWPRVRRPRRRRCRTSGRKDPTRVLSGERPTGEYVQDGYLRGNQNSRGWQKKHRQQDSPETRRRLLARWDSARLKVNDPQPRATSDSEQASFNSMCDKQHDAYVSRGRIEVPRRDTERRSRVRSQPTTRR